MKIKNIPQGTIVKFNGVHLQVTAEPNRSCNKCYFKNTCYDSHNFPLEILGTCLAPWRDDKQNIIFVNLDRMKKQSRSSIYFKNVKRKEHKHYKH